MEIFGTLHLPHSSTQTQARLELRAGILYLSYDGEDMPVKIARVESAIPGVPRYIYFTSGHRLLPDAATPPEFWRQIQPRGTHFLSWLEHFSLIKTGLFLAIMAVCIIGLRLSMPFFVGTALPFIPEHYDAVIGENFYKELKRLDFSDSALPQERQSRIQKRADALARAAGFRTPPKVYFHKSERLIGANALAFPGGPVVITDEFVTLMGEDERRADEKIIGVIAHEFGHIKARHSMQSLLLSVGYITLATFMLGGSDTLLEELAGAGIIIMQLENARINETEADYLGQIYLHKAQRDPQDLTAAMQDLQDFICEDRDRKTCDESRIPAWLSTHPLTSKRINHLQNFVPH